MKYECEIIRHHSHYEVRIGVIAGDDQRYPVTEDVTFGNLAAAAEFVRDSIMDDDRAERED